MGIMRLIVDKDSELKKFNTVAQKGPGLVLYHATWCGHCKEMLPEWKKLEERCENNKKLNIASINEDYKDHISEKIKQPIEGYPSIHFINNGKLKKEYSGQRNNNAFMEFLLENI